MKSVLAAILLISGWASTVDAAAPRTLTTLRALHELSHEEAAQAPAVAFEATVTYYSAKDVDLFVQDGTAAIYVQFTKGANLVPGDRVLVEGHARDSFRPDIVGDRVTLLRHGALPEPVRATFDQMIRVQLDCMRVQVRGVVRSADMVTEDGSHIIKMHMVVDGGYVDGLVVSNEARATGDLLDAEVEVTAVVAGSFDSKMELTGILLEIPSLSDIRIVKRASASPWTLPLIPMDQILSVYHVGDLTQRVRVHGVITYYQPGAAVVLQDGARSIWISTHTHEPLQLGDEADATGFPESRDHVLTLSDGEIQDSHISAPIKPQQATWRELGFWSPNNLSGHQNDLVSIEGEVTTEARQATQDEYVLVSGGRMLTAIYRHPPSDTDLAPMGRIPLGSRIRVTGICTMLDTASVNPGGESSFNILLRSFDDISVIASPSPLSVRNLVFLVGILLVLLFAAGARGWFIERKVRRENASMAYIERRRSRILEDINGSRPLAEIIEQITELVSFRQHGAPCWCRIVDGAQLGNCPPNLDAFRVVHEVIQARTGPPLGDIYAAFDPLTKQQTAEPETLVAAAALTKLAIETRRLYTDLVRRSEFDLLTDIHNRFSMENYLERQIEEARQNATIFGLVYIDLNDFKQVNDIYGHQVGDLYLQEVANRMKHQLRSADMLARLGGDEFAVLLPKVRNRAEVEEIMLRIEGSLDEPFAAVGYVVRGSASIGIALYPEDGSTKDSLLSAADAAMYVNKHIRRKNKEAQADRQRP